MEEAFTRSQAVTAFILAAVPIAAGLGLGGLLWRMIEQSRDRAERNHPDYWH